MTANAGWMKRLRDSLAARAPMRSLSGSEEMKVLLALSTLDSTHAQKPGRTAVCSI